MKAKRRIVKRPRVKARGSRETPAPMSGHGVRQHIDMVPDYGQGPQGLCATEIGPYTTPPAPVVGAGKGFRGW